MTLGEKLRKYRTSHAVPLEAVADELGISISVLSRKERGKPDVAELTRPEFFRAVAKVDEYHEEQRDADPADVVS